MTEISTYDIELLCKQHGSHFFDKHTKKCFASRISQTAYLSDDGKRAYFVTSEQFRGFRAPNGVRAYTVRVCDMETGDLSEVGEFQQYKSRNGAHRRARLEASRTFDKIVRLSEIEPIDMRGVPRERGKHWHKDRE